MSEFNINMQEILHNHDKILNTSGEKEINEVFEGYPKISFEMQQKFDKKENEQ